MHRSARSWIAAGCVVASLLGSGGVAAADPSVTLRLATASGDQGPVADLIRGFAADVSTRSEGSLIVEPVWQAQGDLPNGGDDQAVVGRLVSGELEMALAPARGFDESGSTALQALQTPFLVTDQALATAVSIGPEGEALLADLADGGIVGLALWPDSVRYLVAYAPTSDPFRGPADLAGKPVRAVVSKVTWDLLRAWGAQPSQKNGWQDGDYAGEELNLDGRGAYGAVATGDLPLFTRFSALAVDDVAFSRLTPAQQEALRAAAVSLRDAAVAALVPEPAAAASFCKDGGQVIPAGAEGVAAFQEAAAPVIAGLEADPATADHVAALRALKAATTPAPAAAPCDPAPMPTAGPAASWTPAMIPDGTYRAVMTAADLTAAGANQQYGQENAGTWTWTWRNGQSTVTFDRRPSEVCRPTAEIVDGVLRVTWPGDLCLAEVTDLQWEPVDGGIRVHLVQVTPAANLPGERAWFDRVWEKIQ